MGEDSSASAEEEALRWESGHLELVPRYPRPHGEDLDTRLDAVMTKCAPRTI